MQVSIIIPVHNGEKYLKRCLDSILTQTFKDDFEIILVENGSSDNSWATILEYAKKHKGKIRAFQSKKLGASAARNLGFSKSTGEYIWFVDVDDEITNTAIERLVEIANKDKADLVMFDVDRRSSGGRSRVLPAIDPCKKDWKKLFVMYGMGPWHLFIRRKWWSQNNFLFSEGIIHEDMELMSSLILKTDRLSAIHETFYVYYENPGGVLHQETWNGSYFDIFLALERLYQRFEDAKSVLKYHDELEFFFIWNLFLDSARDFRKFPEGKDGFRQGRELIRKYFPKWRKNKYLKSKDLGIKIRIWLGYLGI